MFALYVGRKPFFMKPYLLFIFLLIFWAADTQAQRQITPVNFSKVTVKDYFWKPRIEKVHSATLPVCMTYTEDSTARIKNFENAALRSGKHKGIYFDDSDVYKVIEGIAYTLKTTPDKILEAKPTNGLTRSPPRSFLMVTSIPTTPSRALINAGPIWKSTKITAWGI